MVLSAAAVVVTAGYLVWKAGGLTGASCANQIDQMQQYSLVGACVLFFFIGRWLSGHRHEGSDPQPSGGSHDLLRPSDKLPETIRPGRLRIIRRSYSFLKSGRASGPGARKAGALIAHSALAFVFACGVLALAYETVAVWHGNPWGFAPITHFVRCARNADFGFTLVVAGTVSLLAGHWLWFPRRPGT